MVLIAVLVVGRSHASLEDTVDEFRGASAVAATETRPVVTRGYSEGEIGALVTKVSQLAIKMEDLTVRLNNSGVLRLAFNGHYPCILSAQCGLRNGD